MNARPAQNRLLKVVLAVLLYFAVIALPLVLLLISPGTTPAGFWWDFSMGLGFAALAMLGLQFVLTARFGKLNAPIGSDILYFFHRWAAVGAVALLLAHYFILRIRYPAALGIASPFEAPVHMTAGRFALAIFLLIVITSLFRKQLRIEYDWWRISHAVLALGGVALAIIHLWGAGQYTSTLPQRLLWMAYGLLWLAIVAYIRLFKPWRLLRTPYWLTRIDPERGSSWTLTFEAAAGRDPVQFAPGQFAWLTIGTSPFFAREHPFSIASSAENRRHLQFTIKELGDFTRNVKNLKLSQVAYVDGPHGVFTTDYHPDAPGFGFVAGGVGIAPIMSILRTLADRRDPRPLSLIYGNASWERVIFREELEQLKSRLRLELHHVLQQPPPDWTGDTGIITPDLLKKQIIPAAREFTFFVCGPIGMNKVARKTLHELGVPLRRIHSEHFDMA